MVAAVAGLNIVLGLVYFQYGTMSLIELRQNWREMGLSRFGLAWIAMAFTCGPHHFVHGIHVALEGRYAGGLDLAATAIAFPAGVTWFLLRVEAFRGGRGDRFIHGTPWWVLALPTAFGVYITAVVMTMIEQGGIGAVGLEMALPNLLLVGIYGMIGFYLIRTQLHNRHPLGGWSLSGLSLAVIFPTCAMMHAIFGVYALRGVFATDAHHLVVDWLSVPAGLYFLHVVRSLYRGSATDWNRMRAPRMAPEAPAVPIVDAVPAASAGDRPLVGAGDRAAAWRPSAPGADS
jgi:hypothetical protein